MTVLSQGEQAGGIAFRLIRNEKISIQERYWITLEMITVLVLSKIVTSANVRAVTKNRLGLVGNITTPRSACNNLTGEELN